MSRPGDASSLRVAIVAGTLGRGGAEKQLVYQLAALREVATVQLFSLTRGEFYESAVKELGVTLSWVGRASHPLLRLITATRAIAAFGPHIVQAAHFYTNIYVAAASRAVGAVEIGSVRNDGLLELADNGRWGERLLRLPRTILTNSETAKRNVAGLGLDPATVHVLPNVIDLAQFDRAIPDGGTRVLPPTPVAIGLGRLVAFKRFDRWLLALHQARRRLPTLRGAIVGDGPERTGLETHARALGLLPDGVAFLGARDDVPRCLREASMLLSCSDHEGFPNVVLEAMAAHLPVITTPAGECPALVRDGENGYVVPFDDPDALATRMVHIARAPALGRRLGQAGRELVEELYTPATLSARMVDIYARAARHQGRVRALALVTGSGHAAGTACSGVVRTDRSAS